jgi:hypothetical protein
MCILSGQDGSAISRIQRKALCMGPYAGADSDLSLCLLQSQLQHIYHAWALGNPMPESTLSPNQGLWIWSQVASLLSHPKESAWVHSCYSAACHA